MSLKSVFFFTLRLKKYSSTFCTLSREAVLAFQYMDEIVKCNDSNELFNEAPLFANDYLSIHFILVLVFFFSKMKFVTFFVFSLALPFLGNGQSNDR